MQIKMCNQIMRLKNYFLSPLMRPDKSWFMQKGKNFIQEKNRLRLVINDSGICNTNQSNLLDVKQFVIN